MTHFYSASKTSFFDGDLRTSYEAAGSWPTDAKEVSDDLFIEFGCANPPVGKVRGADANGNPCWVNAPAPTAAQRWAELQAEARQSLTASDVIVLRCYEDGIALPAAWATYRKALRALVSATSGDASQALPQKPSYPSGS